MAGQTLRSRTIELGLTAVLCLTLAVAAIRVVAYESSRDSDIVLSGARSVTVTGADGVPYGVDEGRLRKGDSITTGPEGSATLTVDGRRVVLGPSTSVVVPDGASLDLRDGSVLVDRRRGPDLRLTAGDAVVDEIGRGALRVDRGYSVRVTVYSARARVRTTTGRRTSVTMLRTLGVSGRSLPPATAMPLTGSPWEREIIPSVVYADEVLNRLARGVDDPERVLPEAIGRAAGDKTALARALRAEGGAWGVVSALVDASTGDVAAALDALGAPREPGPGSTPGREPDASPPGASPSPQPSRTGGGNPPEPSGSPSPGEPTPTPSQGPVDELLDTLDDILPSSAAPLLPIPLW